MIACDISATAIHHARKRAQEHHVAIDFRVVDVLREHAALLRFQLVFERGLLHAFVSEEGRLTFARTVARLLESGGIWLSLAGAAATLLEAQAAAWRLEACLSASQITEAVEPYFDIVSIRRVRYGRGGVTDFPAFASALRKRDLADPG